MSTPLTAQHRKKLQSFLSVHKRSRVRKKVTGKGMSGCRPRSMKGGDILHLTPKGNHIQSIQKTRPYFNK
jgi:hypothetical protein